MSLLVQNLDDPHSSKKTAQSRSASICLYRKAVRSAVVSESIAHLLLELECAARPKRYCPKCRKRHIEIFVFHTSWTFTWDTIVYPLLLQASTA
ncbi:hypothetical protein EV360DRAFT_90861 [Lentinula raphanica]|nr:hypothetical protein EV360DRAFT_90861 [Lentinula raphanica]